MNETQDSPLERASDSLVRGRSPEDYQTLAIVGLGLIGGSLALALRRAGYRGRIIGVSRPESLDQARALDAIDEGHTYEEMSIATRQADLVVLAGPISAIMTQLRVLGADRESLRNGTVVTDVGSTKRAILDTAIDHLPDHVTFIGGHPLAGSEQRGLAAADPFLFQNAFYVLSPTPAAKDWEVQRLSGLLRRTGARVVLLGGDEHDRIAATISHLPQLLAVTLVSFLDDLGPSRGAGIQLAAGGFRDMTRIASSPYSVWKDIIATNKDMIGEVLGRFLESARAVASGLEDHSIESVFDGSTRTRAEIPKDSKGFIHRLWDVLVVVEDRPGTIASIASPLAERGINIQDIEVLKVREGEGGTLRLAFHSQENARDAVSMLEAIGYRARLRE